MQHKILSEEFLMKKCLYMEKGSFFIAGNAKQMPDQVSFNVPVTDFILP